MTEETDYEVIDSHIHIFSTERRCNQLNWLDRGQKLYSPHSYSVYESSGTPAKAAVFVECDTDPGPDYTATLEEIQDAAADPRIKAIVAWAPLTDLAILKDYLQTAKDVDSRGILRGIRVLLQDKPDGFCLQETFIACIRYLGELNLLFEIGIDVHSRGTTQLEEALSLVEQCPQTVFVLNHLAKPDVGKPVNEKYKIFMQRIANHSNTFMKLSGCLTELEEGDTLPHRGLGQYIKFNVEVFGSNRILFGSDWPVLTLSRAHATIDTTPQGWYTYCRQFLAGLGVEIQDLKLIFGGNTKRVYRI